MHLHFILPHGNINDSLTDKLLTKDQYRENLRVSERAWKFFALISTKTPISFIPPPTPYLRQMCPLRSFAPPKHKVFRRACNPQTLALLRYYLHNNEFHHLLGTATQNSSF